MTARFVIRPIHDGQLPANDNIADDLDEPHDVPAWWHREKLKRIERKEQPRNEQP
jgi:hypothetical protein